MTRKHNTKHRRSPSKYPDRLRARGVSSAQVRMPTVESLRKQQNAREPSVADDLAEQGEESDVA